MECRVFSTRVTDRVLNKTRFTKKKKKIHFFFSINNERSLRFNRVHVSKTIVVGRENDSLFVNISFHLFSDSYRYRDGVASFDSY